MLASPTTLIALLKAVAIPGYQVPFAARIRKARSQVRLLILKFRSNWKLKLRLRSANLIRSFLFDFAVITYKS